MADESEFVDIISKFNKIMKNKFRLNGFLDNGEKAVKEKNEFVQVLKISSSHYVTMTNYPFTGQSLNCVSIYDPSLIGTYEQDHLDIIASHASKVIDTNDVNKLDFVMYQPIHSEKRERAICMPFYLHTVSPAKKTHSQ